MLIKIEEERIINNLKFKTTKNFREKQRKMKKKNKKKDNTLNRAEGF